MKMKQPVWLAFRILILGYIAYGACTQPAQIGIVVPTEFLRTLVVLGSPLAFLAALLWCRYGFGLTLHSRSRAQIWSRPGWSACPFQKTQPPQFFHFAAWLFIANAAGNLVGRFCGATIPDPALALGIFGGAFAAGMLPGLQWLVRAHPEYFFAERKTSEDSL